MSRFEVTIEPVSKADKMVQEALLARVDQLIEKGGQLLDETDKTFIEIGLAMSEVKQSKAWLPVAHSWDAYVQAVGAKFKRGRTALYGYVSTVERLLPDMTKDTLAEMGVSKAQALAGLVKKTGKPASAEMLAKASSSAVGVDEFRAEVAAALHEKPENSGKWYQPNGFWATDEERKEIERAMEAAKVEAEVPANLPDWLQNKLALQAMSAECLSSWGK